MRYEERTRRGSGSCLRRPLSARPLLLIVACALACAAPAFAVFDLQTIDTGNTGFSTGAAVSSANIPDICYYDTTLKALKVAELQNDGWHITVVDNNGDVGMNCSIRR